MPTEIYLCYGASDADTASAIRELLLQNGTTAWTDTGLEPGTTAWKAAIRTALDEATCLVVLLTPESSRSARVKAEIDYGRKRNKPVVFALLHGDRPPDTAVIDVRGGQFNTLVTAVKAVVSAPSVPDIRGLIPGPFLLPAARYGPSNREQPLWR